MLCLELSIVFFIAELIKSNNKTRHAQVKNLFKINAIPYF